MNVVSILESREAFKFCYVGSSTALKSDSGKMFQPGGHLHLMITAEEALCEESLISKFLCWLIASVILGKLSWRLDDLNLKFFKNSNSESLQSLLQYVENGCGGGNNSRFDCEEILTATIFFLQLLLGMKCGVLPLVVAALCLLPCDASNDADFMLGHRTFVEPLCSKMHCPAEANPAWR